MRPVIATILFISLLSPMLFTTAWMQLHRWQVRQDLKAVLLSETNNPNLVWLRLSREEAENSRASQCLIFYFFQACFF